VPKLIGRCTYVCAADNRCHRLTENVWGDPLHASSFPRSSPLTVHADTLRTLMFTHTTTFGVRQTLARKYRLARRWVDVILHGRTIPITIAHNRVTITRATPEFDDVAALAAHVGQPIQTILDQARNTATNAGIHPGATLPDSFQTRNDSENSLANGRSHHPYLR